MQTRAVVAGATGVVMLMAGLACDGQVGAERRAAPSYDAFTRRLTAIYADQDGDGRIDQWSYFEGSRPLRGEKDTDGDGRIDRWEYFAPDASLQKIGTSSQDDGVEDRWTWPAGADGIGRVEYARARDRHVDRREYYAAGALTRAEEDTNADGRTDRWDRYEASVLRQVEFDTTFANDRPDRRAVYDSAGRFQRTEVIAR
jgi:hypothetical protein